MMVVARAVASMPVLHGGGSGPSWQVRAPAGCCKVAATYVSASAVSGGDWPGGDRMGPCVLHSRTAWRCVVLGALLTSCPWLSGKGRRLGVRWGLQQLPQQLCVGSSLTRERRHRALRGQKAPACGTWVCGVTEVVGACNRRGAAGTAPATRCVWGCHVVQRGLCLGGGVELSCCQDTRQGAGRVCVCVL
jgi:hypothetical protein